MNHAPGGMANAVPVPPVLIEGRLRVGFVATRDIPAGSEIFFHYEFLKILEKISYSTAAVSYLVPESCKCASMHLTLF